MLLDEVVSELSAHNLVLDHHGSSERKPPEIPAKGKGKSKSPVRLKHKPWISQGTHKDSDLESIWDGLWEEQQEEEDDDDELLDLCSGYSSFESLPMNNGWKWNNGSMSCELVPRRNNFHGGWRSADLGLGLSHMSRRSPSISTRRSGSGSGYNTPTHHSTTGTATRALLANCLVPVESMCHAVPVQEGRNHTHSSQFTFDQECKNSNREFQRGEVGWTSEVHRGLSGELFTPRPTSSSPFKRAASASVFNNRRFSTTNNPIPIPVLDPAITTTETCRRSTQSRYSSAAAAAPYRYSSPLQTFDVPVSLNETESCRDLFMLTVTKGRSTLQNNKMNMVVEGKDYATAAAAASSNANAIINTNTTIPQQKQEKQQQQQVCAKPHNSNSKKKRIVAPKMSIFFVCWSP